MFAYRPPASIEEGPEAWERDLREHKRRLTIQAWLLGHAAALVVLAVWLAASLMITSCAGDPKTGGLSTVTRYTDKEAGVTCWIVSEYSAAYATTGGTPKGIYCMPTKDTLLDEGMSADR